MEERNGGLQGDPVRDSLLTAGQKDLLSNTYKKINEGEDIVIDMHPSKYSLHHLIVHLCEQLGGVADIRLSTFSMSEEVLNCFMLMRERNLTNSVKVICDRNFATKTSPLLYYAGQVLDEIYFTNNHTKITVISKYGKPRFLISGSANLNRNPRWEFYMVTNNIVMIEHHVKMLNELEETSERWK